MGPVVVNRARKQTINRQQPVALASKRANSLFDLERDCNQGNRKTLSLTPHQGICKPHNFQRARTWLRSVSSDEALSRKSVAFRSFSAKGVCRFSRASSSAAVQPRLWARATRTSCGTRIYTIRVQNRSHPALNMTAASRMTALQLFFFSFDNCVSSRSEILGCVTDSRNSKRS